MTHRTGMFTYIWLKFMVNVGKYTIHGWYGKLFYLCGCLLFYVFLHTPMLISDITAGWNYIQVGNI